MQAMHVPAAKRLGAGVRALACGWLLCPLLGSCLGARETPLDTMPDRVDRDGAAGVGAAPQKIHPRGLTFDVSCSLVEREEAGSARHEFHVTLSVENRTDTAITLPTQTWRLRDDDGRLFRADAALRWNPRTEAYEPAPPRVEAGGKSVLVVRFDVGKRMNLLHMVEVVLHWRYGHRGRVHRVATLFRVR